MRYTCGIERARSNPSESLCNAATGEKRRVTYLAFGYRNCRVVARGKDGAPQACTASSRTDEIRARRHLTVTVTVIAADVVDFPVLSVATAISTCWPALTRLVFHWTCHGEPLEVPISVLST